MIFVLFGLACFFTLVGLQLISIALHTLMSNRTALEGWQAALLGTFGVAITLFCGSAAVSFLPTFQ